jgi:hypothetical protein
MSLKMRTNADRRGVLKVWIFCIVCLCAAAGRPRDARVADAPRTASRADKARVADAPRTASPADNCLTCHSQSTGRAAEVVTLHQASTHGKAGVGCSDCHGGDSSQSEKANAHATNFVAKPDANGTLAMCGACHQTALAQFKTSRHFQANKNQARLDCHGAHSVGNPPESFSYTQFCAGCHGLEYLPELPKPFQDLLSVVDEVRDGFVVMKAKGRKPSTEMTSERKELRRLTAELVHPTDRVGGVERIPRIVSRGEKLKQQIKQP